VNAGASLSLISVGVEERFTLRTASPGDLDALKRVRDESARHACGAVYSPAQLAAWLARPLPAKMRALIDSACVLVAMSDGEIVGYGAIDLATAEIEAVFVAPGAMGSGLGRRLLHQLEDIARANDVRALSLSASLNAVPFYRRAGYVTTSRGQFPLDEHQFLEFERMEKRG